jgi:hypothetical protein
MSINKIILIAMTVLSSLYYSSIAMSESCLPGAPCLNYDKLGICTDCGYPDSKEKHK